jgi:hypothetical protein
MGASNCRTFDAVKKVMTDQEWSELNEKYVRIENKNIEADLIYQFDGKSAPGPGNNAPLRCRKTGRSLKNRGISREVINGGGLTSLSIMNPQEARVSTGGMYIFICIYKYTCKYVYTYRCMFTYICVHIFISNYTYTY